MVLSERRVGVLRMKTLSDFYSDEIFAIFADRYSISTEQLFQMAGDELGILKKNLNAMSKPFLYRQMLKALQFLLEHISSENRYRFTNFMKNIIRLQHYIIGYPMLKTVNLSEIMKSVSAGAVQSYWNGYQGVICLTHDVDYTSGYLFVAELADLNNKYGIHSTFNFLTGWDYKPEKDLLLLLTKRGFEIGLHGYTHDIALGFRGYEKVKQDLQKALEEISCCPVSGFRAPALSISEDVLRALSDLNFLYDSSIPGVNKHTGEIMYCFPYKYPDTFVWEIPLSIQDTYFFRDKKLSDKEAFEQTVSTINRIVAMGGIAVLNCHPCIIKDHLHYYRNLLEYVSSLREIWNPCLIELAIYLNKK